VTHQALGVFWPRRPGQTDFLANARGIRPQIYVAPIIVLFVVTFILGATVYPVYRVYVRPPLEDLRVLYGIGLFEIKENFAAIVLAMLPAIGTEKDLRLSDDAGRFDRDCFVTVWCNFIAGHILNNLRFGQRTTASSRGIPRFRHRLRVAPRARLQLTGGN
jgi:hypothetical protein